MRETLLLDVPRRQAVLTIPETLRIFSSTGAGSWGSSAGRRRIGATPCSRSSRAICALLTRPFLAWVLIANALALPAAYLAMQKWLRNFAFHAEIGVLTFLGSALLVIVFAGLTVGYLALRSARQNPVRSLRYE